MPCVDSHRCNLFQHHISQSLFFSMKFRTDLEQIQHLKLKYYLTDLIDWDFGTLTNFSEGQLPVGGWAGKGHLKRDYFLCYTEHFMDDGCVKWNCGHCQRSSIAHVQVYCTSITQSSWIFCINLDSFVARSGWKREKKMNKQLLHRPTNQIKTIAESSLWWI